MTGYGKTVLIIGFGKIETRAGKHLGPRHRTLAEWTHPHRCRVQTDTASTESVFASHQRLTNDPRVTIASWPGCLSGPFQSPDCC
jgi:hypothetical protein